MNKKISRIALVIVLALVCTTALTLAACDKEDEYPTWQLSSGISAKFSDNGNYGYVLTVSGSGKMPDYNSAKDTPWYGKSGRITQIVIEQGITYVGSNSFAECVAVKSVALPQSVTKVGKNAFSSKTKVMNADTSTKILFVGNSFTFYFDVPQLFKNIANSAGRSVVVDSITEGSWTLDKWADVNDTRGAALDAKLKAVADYDIIVLQEQSTRPLNNYNNFLAGATALATKIRQTQNNCDIYLYSTWGYPELATTKNTTIPQVEAQIRAAYQNVAQQIGAKVSNVGAAFSYVYENHTNINLYYPDEKHPSLAGSYLSACVHAATLLGCNPKTATFTGDLDEATATTLREVAYKIVFEN